MLLNAVFPMLSLLIFVPILIALYGVTRWQTGTLALRAELEGTRSQMQTRIYDTGEVRGLPPPVQRFFQTVLPPGQPLVSLVEIGHAGHFNLDQAREHWLPFSSTQVVVTERPGFHWDARIHRGPGIHLFVHDAYIGGRGRLKAALFGLLKVTEQGDTPEMAQGELMRFLAEAVWYPTKLLPSQGVRWEPIDEDSARAILADGDTRVSLIFGFDAEGMIRTVRTDGRYRSHQGALVETPWEGRFWGYETRSGMRIPIQGEAAWILPNNRLPYWRAHVTEALYKFAS